MSLTRREKYIIIAGILCLGLLLAFHIFMKPAIARTNTLKRVLSDKRDILANLQIKAKEYAALETRLEEVRIKIENQQKDKRILSSIEQIQKDCGLTRNVISMTPSAVSISDIYEKTNLEIKYTQITLEQIIQFLLKIESADFLIGIKSLEIKRNQQNPASLDAIFQLVSISKIMPE